MFSRKVTDSIIEKLIFASGIAAILLVSLIFFFLLREGLGFFSEYSIKDFITGHFWYPTSKPAAFGILSLIMGSLFVTLGAAVIAVPVGVMAAFYISEVAPVSVRDVLKSGIELLAAIPSVVIGFIGMVTLVPLVRVMFDIPTGLSAFSGSLMLAFMAMPTIVSISEDAIRSVPWTYKEAALSLGATKWQTMYRIVLPAAAPGILAAVMLGIGRVIGETMAVMMITGNAAAIPESIFDPVRTMTATIAAEMGETVKGSMHYKGLFAIGLVLFVITFIINFIADTFLNRVKK
ncbi:MAG: phosphate ABC transporter permease subunit PstC [Candidatus Firestonebacteria bacterium]|jgi:phosphate transport system permease protein|nr:phosphate ABC transporter permease subunit PstC [Candidatus Firestonebacteria bacterium]